MCPPTFIASTFSPMLRRPSSAPVACAASAPAERIWVRNARGEALAVALDHAPPAARGVALLVHGYRDSRDGRVPRALRDELARHAVLRTVRVDLSGNGESEGAFQFANYRDECEDVRAVVQYLRKEGFGEVQCLAGHSKGAGVVLLYAQKYGDVPIVASLAARCNMSAGLVERFGEEALATAATSGSVDVTDKNGFSFTLTQASINERLSLDMRAVTREIPSEVFVVLAHGDKDEIIPFQDVLALKKELPKSLLVVVEGADHSFCSGVREVVNAIIEEVVARVGANANGSTA